MTYPLPLPYAIERLVVDPIRATGVSDPEAEYDIDEIAPRVMVAASHGWELRVSDEVFWATVEEHKRPD
jgi:hypothetical protein